MAKKEPAGAPSIVRKGVTQALGSVSRPPEMLRQGSLARGKPVAVTPPPPPPPPPKKK